ncbi:MAG: PIN domain-containing protein [Chloroflexota bacterium]|nr:MAG: PIN domain-containing protein [Chloroflexota bacterium]
MAVFVDTSAIYALLDDRDPGHIRALAIWHRLIAEGEDTVTTNYVVLESTALIQRRASAASAQGVGPISSFMRIVWVDCPVHDQAVSAWSVANRRELSLTDCVSFIVARSHGIDRAFAFDRQFEEQGFALER